MGSRHRRVRISNRSLKRADVCPTGQPKGQPTLSTYRGTSQGLAFINTWPYNYYLTCMYQLIRGNALIMTSLPKASVHLDILSGGNGIGLTRHSRKPSRYCWWSQSIKSKSDKALSLQLWCDKTIRALARASKTWISWKSATILATGAVNSKDSSCLRLIALSEARLSRWTGVNAVLTSANANAGCLTFLADNASQAEVLFPDSSLCFSRLDECHISSPPNTVSVARAIHQSHREACKHVARTASAFNTQVCL